MKIVSWLLVFMVSVQGYAVCDWSKGITPGPNNTFVYTQECHQVVGKLVQDSKVHEQKVSDLNKAITLKDLVIKSSDQRAQLWNDTASKLEERLQKVDSLKHQNEFVYFLFGIGAAVAVGYTTAKLVGK